MSTKEQQQQGPCHRAWSPEEFAAVAMGYAADVRAAVGASAASVGLDVDDVFQEAMRRALGRFEGFRSEHHVRPWLIVVARRIVVDHARSARWRRMYVRPDAAASLARVASETAGGGPSDGADELTPSLREALTALPATQRRAVVAHVVHGMTHREIAEELGVTYTAVGPLLHRAMRSLRDGATSA